MDTVDNFCKLLIFPLPACRTSGAVDNSVERLLDQLFAVTKQGHAHS